MVQPQTRPGTPSARFTRLVQVLGERSLTPGLPVEQMRADFEAGVAGVRSPEDVIQRRVQVNGLRADWFEPTKFDSDRVVLSPSSVAFAGDSGGGSPSRPSARFVTDSHTRRVQDPPRRPSEVFPDQLAATRKRKGWTQHDLADSLAAYDVPVDRSTIAKIEKGARGVSLDELFWFAAALDVSPMALCIPPDDSELQVTPNLEAGGWEVQQWFRGVFPLAGEGEYVRFFHDAAPNLEAEAMRRFPGVYKLWQLAAWGVRYAAEHRDAELAELLTAIRDDITAEIRKVKRQITRGI